MINYGGGDLKNFPVEVMEHRYPLKILRYGLDMDSGGPGRLRGGLGIVREYEIRADTAFLTLWFERSRTPGLGLLGGGAGRPPRVFLNPGKPDERSLLKVNHLPVSRGTIVRAFTGGGGGFGAPSERNPDRILRDVGDEYVSSDAAAHDYGVAR
jgi:N-methylhydantoinase B